MDFSRWSRYFFVFFFFVFRCYEQSNETARAMRAPDVCRWARARPREPPTRAVHAGEICVTNERLISTEGMQIGRVTRIERDTHELSFIDDAKKVYFEAISVIA